MGASQSKSTVTQISKIITDVSASVVQKCLVGVSANQNTVFNLQKGSIKNSTISVKQSTQVSSSCWQDSSLQSKLQNDIIAAIKNFAEAGGVGISSANSATYIETLVKNNIVLSSVQEAQTKLTLEQNQAFNYGEVTIENSTFDISQGAELFAASVLRVATDSGVVNAVSTTIDAGATAKGVSLADFLPDVGQLAMLAGIAVVVLLGYKTMMSKK